MTPPQELRELDKKIAKIKFPTHDYDNCSWCNSDDQYANSNSHYKHYSTEISDAWELFEEMQPGFVIGTPGPAMDWYVATGEYVKLVSEAKTASEAICRAWIKWKESTMPTTTGT